MKISDAPRLQAAGVDTGLVAQRATEAYLMQVRGSSRLFCVGAAVASAAQGADTPALHCALAEWRHVVVMFNL